MTKFYVQYFFVNDAHNPVIYRTTNLKATANFINRKFPPYKYFNVYAHSKGQQKFPYMQLYLMRFYSDNFIPKTINF